MGAGLTLNVTTDAEEGPSMKLNSFAGVTALTKYLVEKSKSNSEEVPAIKDSVAEIFKGALVLKNKTKQEGEVFFTGVVIPPPTKVENYSDGSLPPVLVGTDFARFSSFLVGYALDGRPISNLVLDRGALDKFVESHPNWTASAKRLWLTGKIPASTTYFGGRDVVRIRQCSKVLNTLVAKSNRMSLERLRRLAFDVSWSAYNWSLPHYQWFE